jgi:hypothetical protein
LVCGCATKHQLEVRMDWPRPAPHCPMSPKCTKATFIPWTKYVSCVKPDVKYFIERVTIHPKQLRTLEKGRIPKEY